VKLDLWYINNWSLWLDLLILIKTVFEVLRRRNAYWQAWGGYGSPSQAARRFVSTSVGPLQANAQGRPSFADQLGYAMRERITRPWDRRFGFVHQLILRRLSQRAKSANGEASVWPH